MHKDNIVFSAVVIFLMVGVLASIVIIITRSSKPNNDSTLNINQFTKVIAVFSLTIAGFILLYMMSEGAFKKVIATIFFVIELSSFVFWFYDPILAFLSLFLRVKEDKLPLPKTPGKKNRFAVLGCAHNEEAVISQLIESVFKTDYPREMYDLYIICDNCNDDTARVAREAGAIAMERNVPELRGKAFGLSWMFDILKQKADAGDVYDAYVILDADNLISKNFFRAMNRELNHGHEVLQGYLGCKNPNDSWISRSYSVAYWITNFIYQRPHSRLGLTSQLGGTGMVIRPQVIEELGWPTDTLTEDVLFTTRYCLKRNRSAAWVHDAQLFDEKPLKLGLSIKQRTRWMQGHMDTMFQHFIDMVRASLVNQSFKQLDAAFYLIRPLLTLVMFVAYLTRWISFFLFPTSILGSLRFILNVKLAFALMVGYLLLQCFALSRERFTKYILWLPIQLLFSLTVYPAIFNGLIKRKEKYWVSTKHTRAISIEQASEHANQSLRN